MATSTISPTAAPIASPSESSAFDTCNAEHKRKLAEAFVAAYNAGDVDAVLELWDTSSLFDYIDNIGGTEHQPADEAALRDYLTGRFAANDRLELTGVEMGTLPRNDSSSSRSSASRMQASTRATPRWPVSSAEASFGR